MKCALKDPLWYLNSAEYVVKNIISWVTNEATETVKLLNVAFNYDWDQMGRLIFIVSVYRSRISADALPRYRDYLAVLPPSPGARHRFLRLRFKPRSTCRPRPCRILAQEVGHWLKR